MAQKFLTDIELTRGLKDSSGDLGSSGQVLSSTGTGLNWVTNAATASVVYQDGFTGDGTTTAFTLANSIDNENKTQVYLDGVYQHKDTYSLSGTTLTFSTAPPNSSDIEVISFASITADGDILTDSEFSSAGLMKTNGSGTYSIVTDNSSNWNTAYTYSQVGHLPLSGGTVSGNLIVTGDLTINGNSTTLSTQTVEVEDNILQLNTTQGSPDTATATTSGISIYRGNGVTQASFIFDDGDDTWDLTNNLSVAGDINLSGTAIYKNSGDLEIKAQTIRIKGVTTNENLAGFTENGAVDLYYDNSKKFETLSDGAKIHGEFYIDEKITHTGDGNTYLQFQTDRQTYVAGGVEFIDFANTTQDYILIGGSSDIDTRMQGGSGYIFIQGSNGYIGINDASPSYPFEVNGNTHIGGNISVSGTTFLDGDVTIGDTNSAFIGMARAGANYLAATNASGYLVFRTAGSNERMRIDSSGNAGIGTTSPQSKLQVGTRGTASALSLALTDGILFDFYNEGNPYKRHGVIISQAADASESVLDFNTKAASGTNSTKMTILGNGNVGIGTSSPGSQLHNYSTATSNVFISGYGTSAQNDWGASHAFFVPSENGVLISKSNAANNTNRLYSFYNDSSGNAEQYIYNTSNTATIKFDSNGNSYFNGGNLGIGTTSPTDILHTSTSSNSVARFESTDGTAYVRINDTADSFYLVTASQKGSIGGNADVNANNLNIDLTNGNVGIGTTSPGAKLDVNGATYVRNVLYTYAGAGNQYGGLSWNNPDNGFLFLKASNVTKVNIQSSGDSYLNGGNVGIGTTSPDALLELEKSASGAVGPTLLLNNSAGGSGDSGDIIFASYGNTYQRAKIEFKVSSETNNPGNINFYTGRSDLSTLTQKMTIRGNGYVGIGTASPAATLDVSGSSAVIWVNPPAGNHAGVNFRQGGTFKGFVGFNNSTSCVNFGMDGSIANGINVNSSHNVGIGTTSPSNKLHVVEGTGTWETVEIQSSSTTGCGVTLVGADTSVQWSMIANASTGGAGANNLGFHLTGAGSSGGSTGYKMTIEASSGNVGIGTSSPSSYNSRGRNLVVAGSGNVGISIDGASSGSGTILFADGTGGTAGYRGIIEYDHSTDSMEFSTAATERMRIDSSGNVGIKTTSPSYPLEVAGVEVSAKFVGSQTGHVQGAILLSGGTDSTPEARGQGVYRFNEGTDETWYTGTAYANTNRYIWARKGSTTSFDSGTAQLTYSLMALTNGGRLGIGTTNPGGLLHLYAAAASDMPMLQVMSHATAAGSFTGNYMVEFCHAFSTVNHGMLIKNNETTAGRNTLDVADGNGVFATFVNGKVGIGTTSPAYKLHVSEAVDRSLSSSQAQMRIEGNGYGAFFALNTDSFQIGQNSNSRDLTFHSGASSANILERMRIKSHGDVVIGGTSTQNARTASFDVGTNNIVFDNCTTSGAGNGSEFQTFRRNNGSNSVQIGSIVMNGTSGVTYSTSSDYRLKENVVELTNALDRVDQLKPSRFNFISDEGRTIDGFLAHEVSDIVPEAIVGTKDEVDEDGNPKYQSIDQSKLVPLLVGAIKELKAEIEQLKTQINGTN